MSLQFKRDQRGFSLHVVIPLLAIIGIAAAGTFLIHASRAASNPYNGTCTTTIIRTTTIVTTTKYKNCILQAQELLDGIQYQKYKSYSTAIKSVPDTFSVNKAYYLTMNGVYSTATAYAVKTLPGNGTNNSLTNSPSSGSWQILCSDAVLAGLASGGSGATTMLSFNQSVAGEHAQSSNSVIFKATCGAAQNTSVAVSSMTTATTCPSPTPVAQITGYTIAECEDFNNGLGDFEPYDGGGSGTVVGLGRVPSQCTDNAGMLELKQASTGATCGGWMGAFDQRYGYWEVKMRAYTTGAGSGSEPHPVLILWPTNGQWTSELDFFETSIGSPATGYLHCISNPSQNCYILPESSVNYAQWHVYGIQWTPTSMTGYIDGTKWWSTSNTLSFQPLGSSNLTIQLDNLSGKTPVNPAEMDIDWVHMYKPN